MEKPKFYITTPIYYPSGNMTIGHTYTTVAADSMTRFKKMTGYDTYFLTGTDEHGQKIERKAEEAGVTPKQFVDKIVAETKDLWKLMNIHRRKAREGRSEDLQKVLRSGRHLQGRIRGLLLHAVRELLDGDAAQGEGRPEGMPGLRPPRGAVPRGMLFL